MTNTFRLLSPSSALPSIPTSSNIIKTVTAASAATTTGFTTTVTATSTTTSHSPIQLLPFAYAPTLDVAEHIEDDFLESTLVGLIHCLGLILSLISNCSVIVIIARTRKLHTSSSILVLVLAISDLILSLVWNLVPLASTLSAMVADQFHVGVACDGIGVTWQTTLTMSTILHAVVAVDRYLFIVHPMKYQVYVTVKATSVLTVVVFVVAALLAAVLRIFGSDFRYSETVGMCIGSFLWTVLYLLVVFLPSLSMAVFAYLRIWKLCTMMIRQDDREASRNHSPGVCSSNQIPGFPMPRYNLSISDFSGISDNEDKGEIPSFKYNSKNVTKKMTTTTETETETKSKEGTMTTVTTHLRKVTSKNTTATTTIAHPPSDPTIPIEMPRKRSNCQQYTVISRETAVTREKNLSKKTKGTMRHTIHTSSLPSDFYTKYWESYPHTPSQNPNIGHNPHHPNPKIPNTGFKTDQTVKTDQTLQTDQTLKTDQTVKTDQTDLQKSGNYKQQRASMKISPSTTTRLPRTTTDSPIFTIIKQTPPSKSTVQTPPSKSTVQTPPSKSTVQTPPKSTVQTPPSKSTVQTPSESTKQARPTPPLQMTSRHSPIIITTTSADEVTTTVTRSKSNTTITSFVYPANNPIQMSVGCPATDNLRTSPSDAMTITLFGSEVVLPSMLYVAILMPLSMRPVTSTNYKQRRARACLFIGLPVFMFGVNFLPFPAILIYLRSMQAINSNDGSTVVKVICHLAYAMVPSLTSFILCLNNKPYRKALRQSFKSIRRFCQSRH